MLKSWLTLKHDITDNLGNLTRWFADDTSLSYSGRTYDIMKSDINNNLSKLREWAKLWLVDINPKMSIKPLLSQVVLYYIQTYDWNFIAG